MSNPTTQSPVGDLPDLVDPNNPSELTIDQRFNLSEVFCTAFWTHKLEYIKRKQQLNEHLAKADRDEKHDEVLISLCDFSERYMRNVAKTYKSIMGSEFWLKELETTIAEANQSA